MIVAKDSSEVFATDGCYLFSLNNKVHTDFMIGILNSKLFVFLYRLLALEKGRVLAQVKPKILDTLPVIDPEEVQSKDEESYEKIVSSVKNLEMTYESLSKAKIEQERRARQSQLETLINQHDQLVYKLYGLSDDEVSMIARSIESST